MRSGNDSHGAYVICSECNTEKVRGDGESDPQPGEICGKCHRERLRRTVRRMRREDRENASVGRNDCKICEGTGRNKFTLALCRPCWWAEVMHLRVEIERILDSRK